MLFYWRVFRTTHIDVRNTTTRVKVEEEVEFWFERLGKSSGVQLQTIDAISDVWIYFNSVYEYMRTSRLVYKHSMTDK